MALDPASHIQHDVHQAAVIPSGGHGVHQKGKVIPRRDGLISLVQHLVEGFPHQDRSLVFIAEAEVVVQIQPVAFLPQELGAESVDGGDLGLIDQGRLPPKRSVSGTPDLPVAEFRHDPSPKLGGSGFGVGDHQEAVDIHPLLYPSQKTLYQYPCLSGARGGGYQ